MLLQQKALEVFLVDSCRFEKHNLSLTQIYDILFKRIYHDLVVAVLGLHCKREKQPLCDVVLQEEVGIVIRYFLIQIRDGVLSRKKFALQRLVVLSLGRINQIRDQNGLLGLVVSKSSEKLIFVNECELCPRGIHVNLMNQHICDFAVFYHGNEHPDGGYEHHGECCRVCLIKWILSNQVNQHS